MPARLAQLLVARGLLPQETVDAALRQQQARGGLIDTALLETGKLREADLLMLLGEASSFRPVNLADFEPNVEVATFIPPKIAERLCVVPLSLDGNTLHVACGFPVPRKELDEVGFLLGKPLELWVATEVRVREWISAVYKQPLPERFTNLLSVVSALASAPPPTPAPVSAPAPASPAVPPPPPPEAMEEEEGALTPDVVERLARSVASEPLPADAKKGEGAKTGAPATSPVPPPAYTREPLRLNMPAAAPAPAAPQAPQQPQPTARPAPQATPAASSVPPPAYTREPLRLNMPAPQAPVPATAPPSAARAPGSGSLPTPPVYPTLAPTTQRKPTTLPGFAATPSPVIPKEPQFLVFSNPAPAIPPARRTPTQPDFPMPTSAAPSAAAPAPAPTTAPPAASSPAPAPGSTAAATPGAPPAPAGPIPPGAAPIPITELMAPNAQPPRPAAPAASQDVPDWTLAQARAALKDATRDRDRLIDVALRFGRRTFDYVAAFAILRGTAGGWEARGDGMTGEQLSQVSIPLDASSVFRTIAVTRGSYAGPLPPDALSKHYVELFGRQSPRTVFLYPVEVRGRLVALLYGDCGQKPISQRRLSDFILFCQDLPSAFQELILFRKQRMTELRAPDLADALGQPGSPATAPATAPAVAAGLGWSPFFGRASGTLGRAAALPPRVMSEERPPPDFSPLVKRLTGPDAAQRAGAMAELARTPEASARVLAASFPGPTAWSRLPVVELPEADELGPIPAALSRLGRPAAQALAPLLDSADPDTRYFALLTAGNLPYVELVDGVLRGLFDLEPDISSAARVAASALKHLPRFDAAMRDLRQELTNRDPLRRSLAARALGTLHDRDSIEGLINLTGSDDEMCAEAAAEGLREITRATLGRQPRQWTSWWAENRTRRRADWLVAALRHKELDVRLVAIEELGRALNDTLGYYADAPEAEREIAVRRWETAAVDPARARRLGAL